MNVNWLMLIGVEVENEAEILKYFWHIDNFLLFPPANIRSFSVSSKYYGEKVIGKAGKQLADRRYTTSCPT
jgi:hypothetical protein